MSTQLIKVTLPGGHAIDVEEVAGPEAFKDFLQKFQRDQLPTPMRQSRRFLFFTPKQTMVPSVSEFTAYALYQNGAHVAFYKIDQTAAGIVVSHCAPTNERTITPEVRALIEALQPKEILDVGRQKGLYFNQDQELIRRESDETDVIFKQRVITEALRQIGQLHAQHLQADAAIRVQVK